MIINISLFLMAISDLRTYIVSNRLQLLLLLAVIINDIPRIENIILSVLLFIGYKLCYSKICTWVGGADIKIFCTLALHDIYIALMTFYIAMGLGLVYGLIRKQEKLPFVPFIWIGYSIVNF